MGTSPSPSPSLPPGHISTWTVCPWQSPPCPLQRIWADFLLLLPSCARAQLPGMLQPQSDYSIRGPVLVDTHSHSHSTHHTMSTCPPPGTTPHL